MKPGEKVFTVRQSGVSFVPPMARVSHESSVVAAIWQKNRCRVFRMRPEDMSISWFRQLSFDQGKAPLAESTSSPAIRIAQIVKCWRRFIG